MVGTQFLVVLLAHAVSALQIPTPFTTAPPVSHVISARPQRAPTVLIADIDKNSDTYKAAYEAALAKARAEKGLAPAPTPTPTPIENPLAETSDIAPTVSEAPPAEAAPPVEAPPPAKTEEVALSAAQQKIQAAKEATKAKAKAGGYSGGLEGEAKAFTKGIGGMGGGAADKDPFAEADELREKIRALRQEAAVRPLSKSKSALLAQYRQMEGAAREKAYAEVARQEEKAAAKSSGASGDAGSDSSYAAQYKKITGSELPSLPVPSLPSLPSLPF